MTEEVDSGKATDMAQEARAERAAEQVPASGDEPAAKRARVEGAEQPAAAEASRESGGSDGAATSAAPQPAAAKSGSPSPPPTLPAQSGSALSAAFSEDKGCRQTMEDVCVMQLDARPGGAPAGCRLSHFSVFDGHGGAQCASFAAAGLHAAVLKAGLLSKGLGADGKPDAKACKAAVVEPAVRPQDPCRVTGVRPSPPGRGPS
ncbi:hypothetical protein HYH03_002518 [Edaphochlamys debaryana]|uniref:Protein-serine/threonine phosphatase n=1 Tax=Edaphochlamys debaryana TaxID=47281 RepID=A0A835YAV8_9CHLO|nr:hypothetical protein HYH03_002518 [Edaphochlamys debaryana]|eukprot:KAG2499575.1 hypothetical protein HYH03_002518 [Edaphochlamys debaryana]